MENKIPMKEKTQVQSQANKEMVQAIGFRMQDEGKMPCTLELPELPWRTGEEGE